MTSRFLEVSFVDGRPFAAYLRLNGDASTRVARSREFRPGIVVDFDDTGAPLGVEIVHPATTPPQTVLDVVAEIHGPPVGLAELAPLRAA